MLMKEWITFSQSLPICNTMSGFTTVCFDHVMFLPAGYKNKAIAAGYRYSPVDFQ